MYVSMKDMLLHAHHNNYAVMAINCVNMEQVKAVIESAEEEKSAVIINISPRQMKAHGYGYIMAPLIENLAKRASVPVAFNLDHGANFEDITAAMQYGFSSVMIDSSSYEFEENVRRTQQIASLAHGMGLSCEAELGHVGQAAQADDSNVDLYTNVKQAKEFVERTNCDCLAVAIGTAHGAYPKGMIPKLDFERLKELKAELASIATLKENPQIDYMDLCIAVEDAMKDFIKSYMRVIGSSGRYSFEKHNGPELD